MSKKKQSKSIKSAPVTLPLPANTQQPDLELLRFVVALEEALLRAGAAVECTLQSRYLRLEGTRSGQRLYVPLSRSGSCQSTLPAWRLPEALPPAVPNGRIRSEFPLGAAKAVARAVALLSVPKP